MNILIVESMFQKVRVRAKLESVPQPGDFIELEQGLFVVEKVVYRPNANNEVMVMVNYK